MGDGMLSLSWNNHSSTFCHMLSTLRGMERYTDITVACEGKFYEVHKLVLASCSDYFLKMFEKTPCKHPIVVLKDIHCKDIEALLSYMYDGVVSVAQNDLARLINAAEVLQIKGLAVPDEPPTSNKKFANSRCASDDRSSPQAKRPRREENCGAIRRQRSRETSPHSTARNIVEQVSNKQTGSDSISADRNRKESESRESFDSRLNSDNNLKREDKREKQHMSKELVEPQIKVMLEEHEIKEESDNIPEEFEFPQVIESTNLENATSDELGNQDLPLGFSSPSDQSFDSQAGPSGLQTWPGLHEGDLSNQSYPGDMNLETSVAVQSGSHSQPSQHLMSVINANTGEREGITEVGNLKGLKNMLQQINYPYFKESEALRQSHTDIGKKSYSCTYCPYQTGHRGHLNIHMRTHTGEKPFSCSFCPYTTCFKGNLKRHIAYHHSGFS